MTRSSATLSMLMFAGGCASPPPPPAPPAPTAAPAPAAPPAPAKVTGSVIEARSSDGQGRAKVQLANPTPRPCRVHGYTLVWGQKQKTVQVAEFVLPPGERRERWIKLADAEVDATTFPLEELWLKVDADCG